MTTESNNETMQELKPEKPANYFSILGNIFFSPGKAFQEVNRSPRLLWPIIGLIVIGLLVGYISSRVINMESMLSSQMEEAVASGRMTQEQAEQQVQTMTAFAKVMKIGSLIATPVMLLVMALAVAGIFKLFSLFIGAQNVFKKLFAVTIYALAPYCIVYYALFALIASLKDTSSMTPTELNSIVGSNLGALLAGVLGNDALPKFLMNLFRFIDIFIIWEIALLAIGYAAVSKKLKTATAAVWLSCSYAVIAVIGAAIQSMMGR